ncbi:MAG: hypothetical protein FWF46_08585 [Oscillospiraceae bacterium]|nr:hypothetical protein [Oscillospiraceae bacterium]
MESNKERNWTTVDTLKHWMRVFPPYDVDKKYQGACIHGLPFRVSPGPLLLRSGTLEDILRLGPAFATFRKAIINLYATCAEFRELLDRGKPDSMKGLDLGKVLTFPFFRLDLGLSREGTVRVFEIEHSIFGLGIQDILNHAYISLGYGDMLLPEDKLQKHFQSQFKDPGTIVYSHHCEKNVGQLRYLAKEVFPKGWDVQLAGDGIPKDLVYRTFYTWETQTDESVYCVSQNAELVPSLIPQVEEKALLSLIWDRRFDSFFRKELDYYYYFLQRVIPQTCILGEEIFFTGLLPEEMNNVRDLANLTSSERWYVLKVSGYSENASWGRGVWFLNQMSGSECLKVLNFALKDTEHLYVLQPFIQGVKRKTSHISEDFTATKSPVILRITPYYNNDGELLSIGATCGEHDRVHGMVSSIIAPVAITTSSSAKFNSNRLRENSSN